MSNRENDPISIGIKMGQSFMAFDMLRVIYDLARNLDGKLDFSIELASDIDRDKIMKTIILLMRNGDFLVKDLLDMAQEMGAPAEKECEEWLEAKQYIVMKEIEEE